ncbi:MAG: hypothetical protein ABR923_01285 [Terracidiphilus sp.]
MSKVGEGIILGLKQTLAIVEGTAPVGSHVVHTPEENDATQAGKRREAFARAINPRLE